MKDGLNPPPGEASAIAEAASENPVGVRRARRFIANVLWTWMAVGVGLLSGILLAPYVIHKLGDEGYGIWVLVFTLADYYWFLDFGVRSATVKYSSEYLATGETDQINEIINTGVAYFSGAAVLVIAGSIGFSRQIASLFQVSAQNRDAFTLLIAIVGISWAGGAIGGVFLAALEGMQRFDISSRINVLVTATRTVGVAALLFSGHGLVAIGLMVVASQTLGYVASYLRLRSAFPWCRFSRRFVRFSRFAQMARYGVHTFAASIGQRVLDQGPPVLIGHFRPAAFVGYYAVPVRLIQYATDLIDRVAIVTTPVASDLSARGERDAVAKLSLYTSRYSLALFLPVSIVLLNYGYPILRLWVGAAFAAQSAPLLPVLALATIMIPGQFNAAAVLFGVARHRVYAWALVTEALVNLAAQVVVIPRYGILGSVYVSAVLLMLNRGLLAPWLLARALGVGWAGFLWTVYARPLAAAIPVFALAYLLKHTLLPGTTIMEALVAAVVIGLVYGALALLICVQADHRAMLWRGAAVKLGIARRA